MKSSKPNTNNREVSAKRVLNKDIKTMPIKPAVLSQPMPMKAVQRPPTFKPRQSRASQGGGR
jgi:hypothetical protein